MPGPKTTKKGPDKAQKAAAGELAKAWGGEAMQHAMFTDKVPGIWAFHKSGQLQSLALIHVLPKATAVASWQSFFVDARVYHGLSSWANAGIETLLIIKTPEGYFAASFEGLSPRWVIHKSVPAVTISAEQFTPVKLT